MKQWETLPLLHSLEFVMNTWKEILEANLSKEFLSLIAEEYENKHVLPPKKDIFSAFNLTPFDKVRVVFIGQDPYPTPGHAHGLAFSVQPHVKVFPKSLQNLFKELSSDIGCSYPTTGCLIPWAKQGVLLLNSALTVVEHQPGSHSNIGWHEFTEKIIKTLSDEHDKLIFVLLGKHAQSFMHLIDEKKHVIIMTSHPSPLGAHRGFNGSKIFSRINSYLDKPIDWSLSMDYNVPWHNYF